MFRGRVLGSLGATDIKAYIEMRRGDKAMDSTIHRELSLLSAAINYARREWEWEIPNSVTGRKPGQGEGRVRWITHEEAAKLIAAASASRALRISQTSCNLVSTPVAVHKKCSDWNGAGSTGIKNFRPHDLHHTCAAWLVQSGVDLARVRDLLRHKSVQMTERYAHLAPHNVRSAVEALDEIAILVSTETWVLPVTFWSRDTASCC